MWEGVWSSHALVMWETPKGFRSSAPETGTDYVFFIVNHDVTQCWLCDIVIYKKYIFCLEKLPGAERAFPMNPKQRVPCSCGSPSLAWFSDTSHRLAVSPPPLVQGLPVLSHPELKVTHSVNCPAL